MTVAINKSEQNKEDGLAWKVETSTDKEVKNCTKRDNSTAKILLDGEGEKNKHSMLGIGGGCTLPENMVKMLQQ